jgi:excisionase family DNA binding protein
VSRESRDMSNQRLTDQIGSDLFDDDSAARYVGGVTPRAIRDWRNKRGLPFLRVTAKVVRIRRSDLDEWLTSHRRAIVA